MTDVIVALDHPSRDEALALVDELGDAGTFYKVGLGLFTREGPWILDALRSRGKRVFLDLKLLDIPNTVAGAVRAARDHEVYLLTIHATGGTEMMAAAVAAAEDRLRLLAVTVLTSMGPDTLEGVWGRSLHSIRDEVLRLAALAAEAGVNGVVSSALEAAALRRNLGPHAYLVTPGIRPAGGTRDDQARVSTPADAVAAGADALVIGRPVTRAERPADALRAILAEVESA